MIMLSVMRYILEMGNTTGRKMHLFKNRYKVIVTYEAETFVWKKSDVNRLMAAETRF
jgi:hypothetical protein